MPPWTSALERYCSDFHPFWCVHMGIKQQQREQWDKTFDESTQRKDFAGDELSRGVRRAYTSFLAVPCRTRFDTEILETDWRTDFETKLQGLRIIVILLVFEAKLYYNDAARMSERPQLDFVFGQFKKKWLWFGTFCPPKRQNFKFGI